MICRGASFRARRYLENRRGLATRTRSFAVLFAGQSFQVRSALPIDGLRAPGRKCAQRVAWPVERQLPAASPILVIPGVSFPFQIERHVCEGVTVEELVCSSLHVLLVLPVGVYTLQSVRLGAPCQRICRGRGEHDGVADGVCASVFCIQFKVLDWRRCRRKRHLN